MTVQTGPGERRPAGKIAPALPGAKKPDARLDGGEAAQIGDAAIGDFLAAIHHHDAIHLPFSSASACDDNSTVAPSPRRSWMIS